ncbi:MAG TPA: VCBS repeat-containing protein [Nocardioides sp.]|nr:VCBS repeat-containing protein [Nocardioides sp.]
MDAYVYGVGIADVDGDAINDVLAATDWTNGSGAYQTPDGSQHRLWRFRGSDPWTSIGADPQDVDTWSTSGVNQNYGASGLDTGDLDHDGDVDVVVTTDAGVDIFSNDGDGNFVLDRHLLTDDTLIAATGDIDDDGLTDLLAVPWDEVRAWRQTDTGALSADQEPLFSDFPQIYTLLVVDLNGDGLNDVIAQNGVWVKARLQRTRGGFGEVRTLFSGWDEAGEWVGLNMLAVGDVNADGAADLVITRGGNHGQGVVVLPQREDGSYEAPVTYPSLDIPGPVRVADMTGDGLADVMVLHDGWSQMGVYTQQPGGTLGTERLFATAGNNGQLHSQGIALSDITGDGLRDVVYGADIGGVAMMTSSGPTPPVETRLVGSVPSIVPRNGALTISFAGFHARSSFECSLDGSAFHPCESPHTVHPTAALDHTFKVRAVVAGVPDQSPARANFSTAAANLVLAQAAHRHPRGSNRVALLASAHNNGPDAASSARLTFKVGFGLRPAQLADSCAWRTRARTIRCPLGRLAPDATAERRVVLRAVQRRGATLSSVLASATWDPDGSDNKHWTRFPRS